MGGRGGRSDVSSGGVTHAQDTTITRIARRTRDLKKEQYRIVNEDGEIVLEKKGGKHEVSATIGEKRDHLPGAVSIHNHPEGGTFSLEDLNEFGFHARQMVVAAPEGTYKLTNIKYGQKDQTAGWYDMREAMKAAGIDREMSFMEIRREAEKSPRMIKLRQSVDKISEQWVKAKEGGKPQATLDRLMARYDKVVEKIKVVRKEEERKVETKPYHDFYRKNAGKYGFRYEFIKR